MKPAETLRILQKYIASDAITPVQNKPEVFRCHKDFKDNPYQVLYVDCSDNWLKDSFTIEDLEKYQEEILLADYYKQSGSLQWNFYYTFISNSTEILRHSEKKKQIERDETYSRKQILSNQELDGWLSRINNLSKPVESTIDTDLSSVWINKLKAAKLDAVFIDEKYVAGVDRYLDGNPVLSPEETETNKGDFSKNKIFSIDKLEIENYRKHPIGKEFVFGKVNLFKGINGSGKTSLLEAIELMLCGKTHRNDDADTSHIKLEAAFSKDPKLIRFAPSNHSIYKERDKAWYNNANQRTNRLHVSFNRFNFFNADAAYALSFDTDQTDVKTAFQDIALGAEVNLLESRLNGFYDRFLSAKKGFDKLILEHEGAIKVQKALMKELKEIDKNPEIFLKQLIREAKSIKWAIKETDWTKKTVAEQEKNISNALSLLNSIEKALSWYNIIGYNSIIKGISEHQQCLKEIDNIDQSLKKEKENLQKENSQLEAQGELEADLDDLKEYFDEPKIDQLKFLSVKISEQKELIDLLKKAIRLNVNIDYSHIPEKDRSLKLSTIETRLKNTINSNEGTLKKLNDRRNKIETGFSQLEKIVTEIKAHGKEYIKLNPDQNECPLCYTVLSKGELIKSIESSRKNIRSSGVLDDLLLEISTLNKEIKEGTKVLSVLEEIKQVGALLFDDKTTSKSPNSIEKAIKDASKALKKELVECDNLVELQAYFKEKGLTERKFDIYMQELSSWDLDIKDKKGYDRVYAEIKGNVVKLKKKISILNNAIKSLESRRKETFLLLNIDGKDQKLTLNRRIGNLLDAQKYLIELGKLIDVKGNEKLSTLRTNIEKLKTLITTYKKISTEKEEHDSRISSANKSIQHAEKELAEIKPKQARAKKATETINEILTKNSKESFLEKFIEQNKSEISEIFKVIHSPKEFDELVFDADGDIQLQRIGQTKLASLTEISTGQRSALALSIFSALNRKLKNGPNILLFDDPVANIDDLNILSYFDYLREVAINGDRQIFFATANENVAFLFAQKFKFLGEEYKQFEFVR